MGQQDPIWPINLVNNYPVKKSQRLDSTISEETIKFVELISTCQFKIFVTDGWMKLRADNANCIGKRRRDKKQK